MELKEIIERRKSIRKYKPGVVITEEEILEIIKTLQYAPTWKNSQTGRYYVALSEEMKKKVFLSLPEFNQTNSLDCACYLVTGYKLNRSGYNMDGTPTNELGNAWGAYDLGLQNQLLILKSTELGYDTLIMGIRDEKKLREIFDIPNDIAIAAVIALGKRDIDLPRPKRKEIEEILVIK